MGEVLTAAKILARSKLSSLSDVRNLNLWGNDLSDISIMRQVPNVEVVSLSVNSITSLEDLSGCRRIRELYLRKNQISDLKQILFLTALPELRILWLSENPVCAHPNYRDFVLARLPHLQKLDNTDVTEEEREMAMKKSNEGLLSPAASPMRSRGGGAFDFGSPRGGLASPKRGRAGIGSPRGSVASEALSSPRRSEGPSSPASGRPNAYAVRRASVVGDDTDEDEQQTSEPQPVYAERRGSSSSERRVPPLHFPSPAKAPVVRSPVNSQSARRSDAILAAELAAEETARKRTDALEEEIKHLRLAEQAERDAEALARVRAGGGGGVQRSPRVSAAAYSSPYSSPRPSTARTHASAAPLSPHSAASAAAYVSGSVSSRGGIHGPAQTSNSQYGAPSSRPASARPAAGQKPDHMPEFARGSGAHAPPVHSHRAQARPSTAAPLSPRATPSPGSYAPLSPRAAYSMRPHALPPSSLAPAPAPAVHAPPPASARSSAAALTPRATNGLSAPRSTQHNLLCATMAMIEEFDVQHLQWLQTEIQQRIAKAMADDR